MTLLDAGTITLEEALQQINGYQQLTTYEKTVSKIAEQVIHESQILQKELQQGWETLGSDELALFDEDKLRLIRRKAKKYSYASPLVVAIVETYQLLVHSGNRTIKATNDDIDNVIQEYVALNNKAVFGYLARIEKERDLWTDSRVFYIHFKNDLTNHVYTRGIDNSAEITHIYYNPEDDTDIWLYERTFTQLTLDKKEYEKIIIYPDVDFNPSLELQELIERTINSNYADVTIAWDNPIESVIINKGVSKLYSILTWVQCYESLLNMVATVYSAISAIALVTRTKADYVKKTAKAIQEIKSKKNNKGNVGNLANNVILDGDIKTLNAKSALLAPSDLDVFLYQISMVVQLPPYAFGRQEPATGLSDGQNSNELMRLAIESRQNLWQELERDLIYYQLIEAVENGELSNLGSIEEIPISNNRVIKRIQWNEGVDGTFNVIYPPVRTVDIQKAIDARISAHTLDNKIPNSDISTPKDYFGDVMPLLGRQDIKERLANLPDEWSIQEPTTNSVSEAHTINVLNNFANELKTLLNESPANEVGDIVLNKLREGLITQEDYNKLISNETYTS